MHKKLFIILSSIALLLVLGIWYSLNLKPTFIQETALSASPEEFSTLFTPLQVRQIPKNPEVTISPDHFLYPLVRIRESLEKNTPPFTLASKRLAEILTFSNSLENKRITQLLGDYEKKATEELVLISQEKDPRQKNLKYIEVYLTVKKHWNEIKDSPELQRKKTLISTADHMFQRLAASFPKYIISDDYYLYYSEDIFQDKKYGIYKVEISLAELNDEEISIPHLKVNNKVYEGSTSAENVRTIEFLPLTFSGEKDLLEISYLRRGDALARPKKDEGRINRIERVKAYLIQASKSEATITKSGNQPYHLVLFNIDPRSEARIFSQIGLFWKSKKIQHDEHQTIYELHLWPLPVFASLLGIVALLWLAVGLDWLYASMGWKRPKKVTQFYLMFRPFSVQKVWEVTVKGVLLVADKLRKIRIIFIVALAGLIIADVLFLKVSYDSLIFAVMVCWILTVINYKLSPQSLFLLSTSFLVGSYFLHFITFFFLAVKLSNYFFISLLVALAQKAVQHLFPSAEFNQGFVNSYLVVSRELSSTTKVWTQRAVTWLYDHRVQVIPLFFILVTVRFMWIELHHVWFFKEYFLDVFLKEYLYRVMSWKLLILFPIIISFLLCRWRPDKKIWIVGVTVLLVFWLQNFIFMSRTQLLREKPYILFLEQPYSGPWSQVTIVGRNFGPIKYDDSEVYIEGQPHRVLRWENDKIIFVVNPILTKNGDLWITNDQNEESNRVKFVRRE